MTKNEFNQKVISFLDNNETLCDIEDKFYLELTNLFGTNAVELDNCISCGKYDCKCNMPKRYILNLDSDSLSLEQKNEIKKLLQSK